MRSKTSDYKRDEVTLVTRSNMAAEGRCGPLCQHPGCWYSGEKHKIAYHKSQRYLSYLHGLASKRASVTEQQPDKSDSTAEGEGG